MAMMRTILIGILWVTAGIGTSAAQIPSRVKDDTQKQVLVIHSSRIDAPYSDLVERASRTTLEEGLAGDLDYYTEYVDFARFSSPEYSTVMLDFLQHKYADKRLDLIISEGNAAFEFTLQHRDRLFPETPLVFSVVERELPPISNAVGLTYPIDMKGTLDVALKLHPNTRRVFVINGTSRFDTFYENIARQQFLPYQDRLAFTYLPPMPLQELQNEVASLPPDSIIYFASLFEDGAGNKFIPVKILGQLSSVANAPMYCWPEMSLGYGVVGGHLLSEETVARQTAHLALRVLRGENPNQIRNAEIRPYITEFDWRQLNRWGISEDRLPSDGIVRFKEESFLSLYKWWIIGGASLCVAQAFLIFGLVVNRLMRRQAEKALLASYARIEDLAGRLLRAQEEERKFVARELHDDLSQQIAALGIDLGILNRQLSATGDNVAERIAELQGRVTTLCQWIRQLSHSLHSDTLEYSGLSAALQDYCKEYTEREGIAVNLRITEDLETVPSDAALCLYRVTQEALHNVAKHSGAKTAEVILTGSCESIQLCVSDEGRGFDLREANAGSGLGLVSMEERVKLLGGYLKLKTNVGIGTVLRAEIPLGNQKYVSDRLRRGGTAERVMPGRSH